MPPKKAARVVADSMETLYFKHYDEHVAKHGAQTAILLQVGKFFEMYDSVDVSTGISRANVQTIVEICGATVEPKPKTDPTKLRIFWGFPEIALPKFERTIVAAGYTVVIIVQTKDATDRVVSRTVERISSPGTFWDEEGGLAIRKEEQIMLGVYIEPYKDGARGLTHWYIASTAFDIMTGKLVSTETDLVLLDNKPVLDTIQPFWSMYPPAEVVVWWCADTPAPTEENFLTMFLPTGKRPLVHIRTLAPKAENTAPNQRIYAQFLKDIFAHTRALSVDEYLGIEMYHYIRRVLYHLLSFVNDHNRSFLQRLNSHTVWTPEENCILGNSALEQLAVIPTNIQKPHESLLHWLQKTTTTMGKRALRERIMKPLTDIELLNQRQIRIAALRGADTSALQSRMRRISDLPRLYRRFEIGHGTTNDLLELLTSYQMCRELLTLCADTAYGSPQTTELVAHIDSLLGIWDAERIRENKKMVSDAVGVGLFHPWKRGIHADLDRREDEWTALAESVRVIRTNMEGVLEEPDTITWTLKDDAPFTLTTTNRRAKSLAAVAVRRLGYEVRVVSRASSPNATLDTDTISRANAAAIPLRAAWRTDVMDTWNRQWATWFDEHIANGMMMALVDYISQLDVEFTLALVSEKYGYVRPEYVECEDTSLSGVYIQELRHPIIERIHADTPYIPHTIGYGVFADLVEDGTGATAGCGILVYGVNASGKSSLGKAIGMAVLMAQCGMPVPATTMKLIPYNAVYTRILGNDNLWAGMSSFVVEMTEFRSILRSANRRVLVVGDELCAGTETASATAIVAAGIQTLVKRGAHFFFATHLHELADIPSIVRNAEVSIYHLSVRPNLENGSLIYDRNLRPGCGSPMYGLEVCRGLDMDSEFLALAYDLRKQLFRDDGKIVHTSRYNAAVVVSRCTVCGGTGDLETHHIIPQAAADAEGRIQPGKHKNVKENLVVLCETCHTKHHSGDLDIHGWKMTSYGRQLIVKGAP